MPNSFLQFACNSYRACWTTPFSSLGFHYFTGTEGEQVILIEKGLAGLARDFWELLSYLEVMLSVFCVLVLLAVVFLIITCGCSIWSERSRRRQGGRYWQSPPRHRWRLPRSVRGSAPEAYAVLTERYAPCG